jgi:hypothetical protein
MLNLILLGVVLLLGVWFYLRWREQAGLDGPDGRVPERRFVVDFNDDGVSCSVPKGGVDRIAWADLGYVDVTVQASGPFGATPWWVLGGQEGGCVFPQGANGEIELVERLARLPGFDAEGIDAALNAPAGRTTRLWQAPDQSGAA